MQHHSAGGRQVFDEWLQTLTQAEDRTVGHQRIRLDVGRMPPECVPSEVRITLDRQRLCMSSRSQRS